MRFSLLEERSKDSSPNVLVTFPDGYTDRLVLRKHFFNEKDRMEDESHCNYLGHLAKETDACVAMTGCLGFDDVELTIMSTHAIGSNGFVWSKEGDVHMVKPNQEVIFSLLGMRFSFFEERSKDSSPNVLATQYTDRLVLRKHLYF